MPQPELSPGEQPRTPDIHRRDALWLVLFAVLLGWYLVSHDRQFSEHRLYFLEDRKAVNMEFAELSDDWTEATMRRRFEGYPMSCHAYSGDLLAQRACGVDVKSFNGVPALFLSFFFTEGRLRLVSINVPWWSHDTARKALLKKLGPSLARERMPRKSRALLGWNQPDGSAVLFNRSRALDPLVWSAIQWHSPSLCEERGCFELQE